MNSGKGRILVVDDEESIRTIIAKKLESEGYNCVVVSDGLEAVTTASKQDFDLVLTDIKMPGMSGLEVLSRLVTEQPDTCVVMSTAVTDTQTAIEAMKLGAYDYVTKPFDLENLSMRVEKAIERKRLIQENKDCKLLLTEEALRKSEEDYYALIENLSDAIVKFKDGVVVWCNERVKDTFGYAKDELVGKKASLLFPQVMAAKKLARAVSAEMQKNGVFRSTTRFNKPDRAVIDIEYSLSSIPDRDPVELVVVARDITERTRIELELKESEEKLKRYLECSPEIICVTDPKGNILYVNEAVERVIGYRPREFIGKNFFKLGLLAPDCASNPALWLQNERENNTRPDELELIKKDGSHIYVEVSTFSVCPEGDESKTEIIGIVHDITERKLAEAAIKELNRLKSEFVANVSHELRTPLQAILSSTSLMLRGKVPDIETQKEFLTIIGTESRHLAEMINDLLDTSRMESGQFRIQKQPMSITNAIHDAIQELNSLAIDKGIEIKENTPAELPEVEADAQRLRQLMINLLGNAIKFTNEGDQITVTTNLNSHEIMVQVSDNGIGIPDEAIPHLFQRFYQVDGSMTRASRGSGLGLYISGQIVASHGGQIWAESKLGEGSTFSFTIPLTVDQTKNIVPVPGGKTYDEKDSGHRRRPGRQSTSKLRS